MQPKTRFAQRSRAERRLVREEETTNELDQDLKVRLNMTQSSPGLRTIIATQKSSSADSRGSDGRASDRHIA